MNFERWNLILLINICSVILFLCNACYHKAEDADKVLTEFLGSTIRFPGPMEDSLKNYSDKNLLIIVIDSTDCTSCTLQNVDMLKLYKEKFIEFNTGILIIAQRKDKNVKSILDNMGIDFPIFYDDSEFILKNKLMYNSLLHTFLINREKKVIWVGSPIRTENSWNLFCQMMKKIAEGQ